jgi:hypothetical protein
MWVFEPLDYKCRILFKFKRNGKKLIDGWDMKIERIYSPSIWPHQ